MNFLSNSKLSNFNLHSVKSSNDTLIESDKRNDLDYIGRSSKRKNKRKTKFIDQENTAQGFQQQLNDNKELIRRTENIESLPNERLIPNSNNHEVVLRILVVDDEKLIRQSQINIIKKFLGKKNTLFEIEECQDGIECLFKIYVGIVDGIKYDLIITDETMNFMNGSFMAKILKKLITDNIIHEIKIFMVTSYDPENYADLQGTILEKIYTKPISMNIVEDIFGLC